MKYLALLLTIPIFLCAADFQAGLDAFNRGDYAAALQQWQPIADRGDPNAQYNLGLLYAHGQGVPQDWPKAIEWYRKAADQGVAAAQYNLGAIYANGEGVPRNPQEAQKWLLKAAEQGIAGAQLSLGRLYSEGGVPFANYAEAEKWFRKAVEQGDPGAAFELGVMYDLGRGVPQNFDEALKWYHKAADASYASALTNIGVLYYNGQGVKRDPVEAYSWLARGLKAGDHRAVELLSWVGANMKPEQIRKAQNAAAGWQPPAAAQKSADARWFKTPQPTAGAPAPKPIQDVWTGVDRVIAVGDIHGDYEQFVLVLQSAGLIDGNGNWTGGKAHLVQMGDIVDRGPDSRAIMDLLMRLEQQAAGAGGAVHCLIGNHEALDALGDLYYVSAAEFAAFAPNSQADRATGYGDGATTAAANPDIAAAGHNGPRPPGYGELRAAFGPEGKYGRWIRSHNAAIRIDRTLFVHAGLGPEFADLPLDAINSEVRASLNAPAQARGGIAMDHNGPLWYRGLAEGGENQTRPLVDRLLQNFDVDRIVVGHSYTGGAVMPRFGGKVVMVDVGLSRVYDNNPKLACLEIDKGRPFALHRGQKLELPTDANGPDMLRYLRAAAALDPQPSPLLARIQESRGTP